MILKVPELGGGPKQREYDASHNKLKLVFEDEREDEKGEMSTNTADKNNFQDHNALPHLLPKNQDSRKPIH